MSLLAGKYLVMIGDTIHLNMDEFKKDFKPRETTDPSIISKTNYIKVDHDIITIDMDALRRDFELR
jgi:hypothetical protein